jgi:hypothetical protein
MSVLSCAGTATRSGLVRKLVVGLLVAIGLVAIPLALPAHAQDNDLVKVYVVRTPAQNGGVADTLPEIAQRTLGTQSRASEILGLNKGRTQPDGGVLDTADQQLHPGWILRLPSDAAGPFVQFGRLPGASTATFTVPVTLAVIGGVLLILITLLLVLRRQTAALARGMGRFFTRLSGPWRARGDRRARRRLAQLWRADDGSRHAAQASLAAAARATPASTPGPVAVELSGSGVQLLPAVAPQPWQAGAQQPPTGPAAPCLPVLIGGQATTRLFVDLTYCDGALALAGDSRTATELLDALMAEIATHHRGLRISYLGAPPTGTRVQARGIGNSRELASLIGQSAPLPNAPVVAAAARHHITDIIAVPATVPTGESAEIVRLCSARTSTWTAIIAQDAPGAHWRCDARRDGTVRIPLLGRTVIAAQ